MRWRGISSLERSGCSGIWSLREGHRGLRRGEEEHGGLRRGEEEHGTSSEARGAVLRNSRQGKAAGSGRPADGTDARKNSRAVARFWGRKSGKAVAKWARG